MATYAIGDIQGCFQPFMQLLKEINFDAHGDTLWLTGDLVNRGPASLEVLRFVYDLGGKHQIILGNHDLHLLAVAANARAHHRSDTLAEIMDAPDKDKLLEWLRHRPLLVYDASLNAVMVHAGLAPAWKLEQAIALAKEVETVLQGGDWQTFLKNMYGNQPDLWHDTLTGMDRLRCIVNYFTRMRCCDHEGRLNLTFKGALNDAPADCLPWFKVKNRKNTDVNIIFGHWAALNGETQTSNVSALDTGCIWGNRLSAMRLEDGKRFSVSCEKCALK